MTNAANEMGVFERVVERGSFAAAAQDVGLSPSAISKLISRLEQRLGVRLINRTTRRLALTAEGRIYLKRSQEILAAIEATESEIALARLSPRGLLRVQAPPVMIGDHFGPALSDFLARYPRMTVEFLVTNRPIDLVAENVDVAMRTGKLPDSSMIACKIIDLTQIICASPEYLAHHGRPMAPADLARHQCLILNGIPEPTTWTFKGQGGRIAVEVKGTVSADSSDVLLRLAIEGVGIVRLGELAVARALRTGLLEPLLLDVQVSEGYPLWALLPPGRQRSPKVKVFLDFLRERLGLAPWRATAAKVSQRRRHHRAHTDAC
ncbi:LysR family transcriptional regulator [Bradyrhizobium lablabi]|uniref:LysR family transcriptional regulator n=1 Tax=Bradyrhizobium lablabi TaxID=722472 RepID=UPI001BADDEBA|nr:LysR family transcriptional regulator [Bradyrhizobium lablabi]MBR0696926.1 LysR family transcriptional regulator [Bradyrhizobium lablabi]